MNKIAFGFGNGGFFQRFAVSVDLILGVLLVTAMFLAMDPLGSKPR